MDKFVEAIEAQNLSGNDALIYQTPDNSYDQNMEALLSLRNRLREIKGMDESSWQYQQAILQITQQEQGEAKPMLDTLEGVWYKQRHFWYWTYGWLLQFGLWCVVMVVGFVMLMRA